MIRQEALGNGCDGIHEEVLTFKLVCQWHNGIYYISLELRIYHASYQYIAAFHTVTALNS